MAKQKISSKKGRPKPSGKHPPQTPPSASPTTPTKTQRSPRMIEQPSPPDSKRREGVFRSPNPEFLSAVRTPPDNTASNEPGGLSFAGNTCYRNAVVIMLLSTRPIMSFIQNYHKLKLLSLEYENDEVVYNNGLSLPTANYSNLLLDLDRLYPVLWDTPSKEKTRRLRQEMDKLERSLETNYLFTAQFQPGHQSDARQFLEYFLNQCGFQLDETSTFLQDAQDFRDLFTLSQADRKRCRGCWQTNHVKHRTSHIQTSTSWTLVMKKFDNVGQEIKQNSFTLDELLRQWRKTPGESWYCDDCVSDFEARFKDKYGHLDKNSPEYRDAKQERDSSNEDWRWYSYVSLPEVLFVDIIRFQAPDFTGPRAVHPPKDQRAVEIPEYVDITPALDKDVPAEARRSTKYRLRAVILHAGSVNRIGICSGHYVNYIRSADDQWWYVNDHKDVESMPFEDVNKPRGKAKWGYDFTPYILCYERVIEDPTPTPQGQDQSKGVSFDAAGALEPPPGKKSESRSTETKLSEEAPDKRPAKVSQGVQTAAASTTNQGTQTAPARQMPASRSTISQGAQTASTNTRSQDTQTALRRTTSQATQTGAPRTTSQGTQTTRRVQVDASTQRVSRTPPPASPPSPPQQQAILHLFLTLGSTTYNLTPKITDLSPLLLEEIARGAKPSAKWMATIELPPIEQVSSKHEGKARKGGRVAKAGMTKSRAGAVPFKRLIELDPAVTRTFFLANDVTSTMRRSARVAGRKQAMIKKQQEEVKRQELGASGKGKNKRCNPFCDNHCPDNEGEGVVQEKGAKGDKRVGIKEAADSSDDENENQHVNENKKRKKTMGQPPAKRQKVAEKMRTKKIAATAKTTTVKTAKRSKITKSTAARPANASTNAKTAPLTRKAGGGGNTRRRPPVPQRRSAPKKITTTTTTTSKKPDSAPLSSSSSPSSHSSHSSSSSSSPSPSPPPHPPPPITVRSISPLSSSQTLTTLALTSSSPSAKVFIKKESLTLPMTATTAGTNATKFPPSYSASRPESPSLTPSGQVKGELDVAARDTGERCGPTPSPGGGADGGVPAPGAGGSADGGVSPRTRVPLSPVPST